MSYFFFPNLSLSTSAAYTWVFTVPKNAIICAIREGVEIHRCTCLHPDWSRRSIGYFSSSNTTAAPLASQTAALGDGRSPWPAHSSCPLRNNATQPSKMKPWLLPGALNKLSPFVSGPRHHPFGPFALQEAPSPFTDHLHYGVPKTTLAPTMAISPWRQDVSSEPQDTISTRVKIDGSGRLMLHNRRFLRAYTPVTPSIEPQPMVPPSPPSTVHTPAQPPPLTHCFMESGSHPSMPPSPYQYLYTSSTCTLRFVLECSYSTPFRHCTGPGTAHATGCDTRVIIPPASITRPMAWTSPTKTFWTWEWPMGTTLSTST